MNEITANSGKNWTTAQIGSYVHTAAQMERDIYTMNEVEQRLKEDAENEEDNIESFPDLKLQRPEIVPTFNVNEKDAKLEYRRLKPYRRNRVWLIILSVAACFAIALAIEIGINVDGFAILLVMTVAPIVGVSVGMIHFKITQKKYNKFFNKVYIPRMKKMYDNKVAKINEYNESLDAENKLIRNEHEKICAKIRSHNQKVHNTISAYKKQAEKIREKRMQLEQLRNKYYSIGVIPPDYRTMDCAYVLDHIFRNDLADTMRQAI